MAAAGDISGQQCAHRVLGELLDCAAAQNLPAIEWRLAAFEPRLFGRCTAYPEPGRRRADFEAWRAVLGADVTEDTANGQTVRLTAHAEREEGLVAIEIAADLYDDLAVPVPVSTPGWRSP
jgi:hypothetical protein